MRMSGPSTAQIGSEISLSCSSQESNPPSIIRWTVDGVSKTGTQDQVIFIELSILILFHPITTPS